MDRRLIVSCLGLVFLVACGDDHHQQTTPATAPIAVKDFGAVYDVATNDEPVDRFDDLVARVAIDSRGETSLAIFATTTTVVGFDGVLHDDGSFELTGTGTLPKRTFPASGTGIVGGTFTATRE